jgi:hypothetical protein
MAARRLRPAVFPFISLDARRRKRLDILRKSFVQGTGQNGSRWARAMPPFVCGGIEGFATCQTARDLP